MVMWCAHNNVAPLIVHLGFLYQLTLFLFSFGIQFSFVCIHFLFDFQPPSLSFLSYSDVFIHYIPTSDPFVQHSYYIIISSSHSSSSSYHLLVFMSHCALVHRSYAENGKHLVILPQTPYFLNRRALRLYARLHSNIWCVRGRTQRVQKQMSENRPNFFI